MLAFDLDDKDDIDFVHAVQPIVEGVVRIVEPAELYLVKIDSWFGDKWLGFSNKVLGAFGIQYRKTLRVPPFVPARVVSERFYRRGVTSSYDLHTSASLHVEQSSEDNARRRMSVVCPDAAIVWWTGTTRSNQRGALMAYLPTPDGHSGWYAELKKVEGWRVAQTSCTSVRELESYALSTARDGQPHGQSPRLVELPLQR